MKLEQQLINMEIYMNVLTKYKCLLVKQNQTWIVLTIIKLIDCLIVLYTEYVLAIPMCKPGLFTLLL